MHLSHCPLLPSPLSLQVAMYWEDNPEPQFIRTVAELEAALDKCKALYPTIVPAPRRFTDVEVGEPAGSQAGLLRWRVVELCESSW